ncbi:MAG: 2'-5' RNA ligase family protein, partial [Spirochaetota bacterium]
SIWGVYNLLPTQMRQNVIGVIVNKFRGDITLFDEGIKIIENKFNEIEKILDNIGIKKEQRSFKPHLTIARVKYADFNCFNNFKYWGKLIGFEENKLIFKLNKLKLYQSILTPQKPIYKVIYEF